jgi:hypothetical protein
MSTPDVIDPRFDELVLELRATRAAAPAGLRERLRGLAAEDPARPTPRQPRRTRRLRLALVGAPLAAAAAAAAAVVIGIVQSGGGGRPVVERGAAPGTALQPQLRGQQATAPSAGFDSASVPRPAPGRAQVYAAQLVLRVSDLSAATKRALRLTRAFGGYVRSVDYGSSRQSGQAELVVRVPVRRVQEAIVRFSALGRILAQHVSIQDVQPSLDRRFRQIQALRGQIGVLEGQTSPQAVAKLAVLRRRLAALQRAQVRAIRQTSYATLSLSLQTKQAVAPAPAHPSRLHRALDRAGAVLVDELIVCLYALVVGVPILVLLGAIWLGARALRRRALERLLERS